MSKETQHLLLGCLSILFVPVFGCATQGELKALKEESRNEWVTIQRALTGRIDETNRQLDAQKKVSEEQQHALSELKRQIGSAASLRTKVEEMQRYGMAQQVVRETFLKTLKTEQLALVQRLQHLNETMRELEHTAQPIEDPVTDKPVRNEIPAESSIKSK